MPFVPSIQALIGTHTGGLNQCAPDWQRNNVYIIGPNGLGTSYLSSLGLISGVEQNFALMTSYSVPSLFGPINPNSSQPIAVDGNGDVYLNWDATVGGGFIQVDGSSLAQITYGGTNAAPTAGFIALGGTAVNIPYGGQQYLLANGQGPGTYLNFVALFNQVTYAGLYTTFGAGVTPNSNALSCAGAPGSGKGFVVYGPQEDSDTQELFLLKIDVIGPGSGALAHFLPTDINGAWTKIYPVGICVDQTDGNILLWCQNSYFLGSSGAMVKVNSVTGAIIWNTAVPSNGHAYVAQFALSSIAHQSVAILTGGLSPEVTTINTASGASSNYTAGLAGVDNVQFQCYNDTLGGILCLPNFLNGAGSPTRLNATPTSFNGWAMLYVNPAFVAPTVPGGPPFVCLMGPANAPGSPPPAAGVVITTESGVTIETEGDLPIVTET